MQLRFTKTDGTYTLDDALNLPDDHAYTEEELEAMMQARFDNWVLALTTEGPEPPPEESEV
jgi:hypothetical protein